MVILTLEEKVAKLRFMNKRFYDVLITCMHNPAYFFVRSLNITDYDMKTLERRGRRYTPHKIAEKILVVYYSETLKRHVRGMIVSDVNDACMIYAMDYGCYDISVPYRDIYEPGKKIKVPGLATECRLSKCYPKAVDRIWSSSITNATMYFIEDSRVKIFVQGRVNNCICVDLYKRKDNINISEWLIYNEVALSFEWHLQGSTVESEDEEDQTDQLS